MKEETIVIFRKWPESKGGGILALFPEIPVDLPGYHCQSYEHVGQHGSADYPLCIAKTKPAAAGEYACLKTELEKISYRLRVVDRITPQMVEARKAQAAKWRAAK